MLAEYSQRLRELSFVEDVLWEPNGVQPGEPDYTLELSTPSGTERLRVRLLRSHLSYAIADRIVADFGKGSGIVSGIQTGIQVGISTGLNPHVRRRWILLAPHIGGPMGKYLRQHQVNYLDLHGNCHLRIRDVYIADVERRTPPRSAAAARGLRAPAYQVLFALLARPPLLKETLRVVAKEAGVSRQAVSNMLQYATGRGILVKLPAGYEWVPGKKREALDLWLHGYESTVRPATVIGEYQTAQADPTDREEALESLLPGLSTGWRWGGSSAGYRLDGHFRDPRTTIHVEAWSPELPTKIKAVPRQGGNLMVLRIFSPAAWGDPQEAFVSPLCVYTEMATRADERVREAAQLFLERRLPDFS